MRADRLLTMMMLLQTRGKMTSRRLAEELEVSPRTILRDVDALSAAGIPIYAEGGHGGGIMLVDNFRSTLTAMQDAEVHTLFIGDNANAFREIGLHEAAKRAMLKLLSVLPTSQRPAVEFMRQRILIDPAWWWRDEQQGPLWEQLQQAVYEDRCIRIIYERHGGEVVKRDLEPYSLVSKSSVWYVIAIRDEQLRTYRVARIREAVLLEHGFRRREDFDLPTYWRERVESFTAKAPAYEFTVRIHLDAMQIVKRIVPGRYRQVEPPDMTGCSTVRFRLETPDMANMLVLGLGDRAQVLEPSELRESVLKTARAIVAKLTPPGSQTSELG